MDDAHPIIDSSDPALLREVLRRAVDFRGDVTVELRSGERIEGFAFDFRARPDGGSEFRLLPSSGAERVAVRFEAIARVAFTGKDAASGKSWENWIRRYAAKKLAGEAASIECEPLQS